MAAKKYLATNSTTGVPTEVAGVVASAGAGDDGKIVALDTTGKLDTSVMPVGVAAATASVISSENLAAGDLVSIYNNSGVANCRKADASTTGKNADGFVISAVTAPAAALVYFPGEENTAVTGLTPGQQFLSATTPGKPTTVIPTAAGQTVQRVGLATSATNLIFEPMLPYVLS